jgi:hypothetical protein
MIMASKQAPNRTTVNLTYLEDKASKPVRAVLGLRQVLSAGVRHGGREKIWPVAGKREGSLVYFRAITGEDSGNGLDCRRTAEKAV